MKALLSLLFATTFLSGCASVSARKVIELDGFQRVFVEARLNDNHRLHELLVSELRRMGREASSGPMTMMPNNAEAVLTYDARWEWNFKTYLVEFNLELHTSRSQKKLADATFTQPPVLGKPPSRVVRAAVERLFAPP